MQSPHRGSRIQRDFGCGLIDSDRFVV